MKLIVVVSILVASVICSPSILAGSIEKANMLNEHGLVTESKKELIDVIFSKAGDSNKAEALYLLGNIAFDERKIGVALEAWKELVAKYSSTDQANLVKDRIQELTEVVGESAKETVKNAVALSYLRHGDFWSQGKDRKFTIESSWIPKVESANKWYEKVISEFPKSNASRIAYQDKMKTLLGWKTGRGRPYGVKMSFDKYMPKLLETFSEFEKIYPEASTLQAFRYQIAQAYWAIEDYPKTREWLNIIVEKGGESDSFYKDIAERKIQSSYRLGYRYLEKVVRRVKFKDGIEVPAND